MPTHEVGKTRFQLLSSHLRPGGNLLWNLLAAVGAYTVLICWIDRHEFPAANIIQTNAAISMSAVLGLLLIFRTNSAYDRWWEGRKLWGQLVNDSRNLAIKTRGYADELPQEERAEFSHLIASFAVALKDHLRGTCELSVEATDHCPSAIALQIYKRVKKWRKEKIIDEWEMLQLDPHARSLMDICGGTERIAKSPIAGSYKTLLWLGLSLNALILPWIIVPLFHWWSLPIILVSSYFVFGLELLAEEVERPFDNTVNDLPLDAICKTIADSVQQSLELECETDANPSAQLSVVKLLR